MGATHIAMLPARFLSFTGCEARNYAYFPFIDNTITLNATLSDPLIISWICTNRFWILCEGNKSVGHHIYLYSPTHSIIGNTLSDIRPFTFVLGLNETEGTISINRKALALYSVFNIFSILGSQRLCRYGVVHG